MPTADRVESELRALGFRISQSDRSRDLARALTTVQRATGMDATGEADSVTEDRVRALARVAASLPSSQANSAAVERFLKNRAGAADGETAAVAGRQSERRDFIVFGQVWDEFKRPAAGFSVRVFDKDLRDETLLGSALSDRRGAFRIAYGRRQFSRAESRTADLLVRVYASRGDKILVESAIRFNASPRERFELELTSGGSAEFARLKLLLAPLLQDRPIAELSEDDIAFLAGETATPPLRIAYLVQAHRAAGDGPRQAELYYGLFRQDMPTRTALLALQPRPALETALRQSQTDGVIAAASAAAVNRFLATFERQDFDSNDPLDPSVEKFLDLARLPARVRRAFLALYYSSELGAGDVAEKIDNIAGISRAAAARLQRLLRWSEIVRGSATLLENLAERAASDKDLVNLSRADWRQIVASLPATEIEDGEALVDELMEAVEVAYPTLSFREQALRDDDLDAQLKRDLRAFFRAAPEFDLDSGAVDDVIDRGDVDFRDAAALRNYLKPMQRLGHLTPRQQQRRALAQRGFHSAYSIATVSRANFITQMGDVLGDSAGAVHTRASQKAAEISIMAAATYDDMTALSPAAVGSGEKSYLKEIPTLAKLFGSLDLCECEHCRSIYGPAAYFVDLMQFVGKAPSAMYQRLRARRPDLEHLQLTCENSQTPMPYVDLADEVMEFYVAHDGIDPGDGEALANDTDAAADELAVTPQYPLDAAYHRLQNAVWSLDLPFERALEHARIYLDHIGTSRAEILRIMQNSSAGTPSELELDLAVLDISATEYALLSGDLLGREPREFYGYPPAMAAGWKDDLSAASEFLRRTGLSYRQLVDLLKTRHLNPGIHPDPEQLPAATLVLYAPDSVCDLEQTSLRHLQPPEALNDAEWMKIHRFARLVHKLGWSALDVDRLLHFLNLTAVDAGFIRAAAALQGLRRSLNLSVSELLGLWGPIDSFDPDFERRSPYHELFQNRAVLYPLDRAFALSEPPAVAEIVGDGQSVMTLAAHQPALLAALRIGAADLTALRAAAGLSDPGAELNLDHVSRLWRHATLARALRLTVSDEIALGRLLGWDFTLPLTPAQTETAVSVQRRINAAGFTPAQLSYLYRHTEEPGITPLSDSVDLVLRQLRQDLQAIVEQTRAAADPTGEQLLDRLAQVLDQTLAATAHAIVDRSVALSEPQQAQFIDDHFAAFVDPAAAKNQLLDAGQTDAAAHAQQNRDYLMPLLLDHLRDKLSRARVYQSLATALSIESATAQHLIDYFDLLGDFLLLTDPAADLADRRPAYLLLHKAALLSQGFALDTGELAYIGANAAAFGGFDLTLLPLTRQDPAAVDAAAPGLFAGWLALQSYYDLRERLPRGELSLLDVLGADDQQQALARLASLLRRDLGDLQFLSGAAGFDLGADELQKPAAVARIWAALDLARRTGLAPPTLRAWSTSEPDDAQSRALTQAVKARYDDETWRDVGKRLNDQLRERQRSALVAYLLRHDTVVALGVRSSAQLQEHLLIDVHMDPCFMTSRLKQAIASVQTYIQRCRLNLESGISPEWVDATQWEWMKHYRVWEANRKVFTYAENWIEPELRDDKSPFFEELENELLQDEITLENVERALLRYLRRLDEVAQLDIVAFCRETAERRGPGRDDVLHIFGRTPNHPARYFYRRFYLHTAVWSPWQRVDLDIQAQHLIPVVWNRRLYLFWPNFEQRPEPDQDLAGSPVPPLTDEEIAYENWEKEHAAWQKEHALWQQMASAWAQLDQLLDDDPDDVFSGPLGPFPIEEPVEPVEPPKPGAKTFEADPPVNRWEIKMSWSEYREGSWSAKKISDEALYSGAITSLLYQGERYPKIEDHYFTVSFADSGGLSIHCSRRYDLNSDPAHLDYALYKGAFQFSYCDGVIRALPWWGGVKRRTPKWGRVDNQEFSVPAQQGLTFFGPAPGLQQFSLLDATPTGVQITPPTRFDKPDSAGLLGAVYPFSFQDHDRAYLALPIVARKRRRYRPASSGPSLDIRRDVQLIERFQFGAAAATAPIERIDAAAIRRQQTRWARARSTPARAARFLSDSATLPFPEDMQTRASTSPAPPSAEQNAPSLDSHPALGVTPKMQPYVQFRTHFHPLTCVFIERLQSGGIWELLSRETQSLSRDPANGPRRFSSIYRPTGYVHDDYPREDVDFDADGAYAGYNWELFFHVPLLLAQRLTQEQRFEEAMLLYHVMFNPTQDNNEPSPQRYWNTLPFYRNSQPGQQRITQLLRALKDPDADPALRRAVRQQIAQWRENPFNPHLIARLRVSTYQKNVVTRYIDNLIQWGDRLFRRDTIESLNEASQLYLLAGHLLGERPQTIPRRGKMQAQTYLQLRPLLDDFSNALVELENEFPFSSSDTSVAQNEPAPQGLGIDTGLYFCIPQNDKLLELWDRVEDRLYKIRHCMNLQGQVRQLPLYAPPIDPALLVRATALGLDIDSVLDDAYAPLGPYRYGVLSRAAMELARELKQLGGALLAALEKQDAEQLAALRAGQELALLDATADVRKAQIAEAKTTRDALETAREAAVLRRDYYQQLIAGGLIIAERAQLSKLWRADQKQSEAAIAETVAVGASKIPDIASGSSGTMSSPVLVFYIGGSLATAGAKAAAQYLGREAQEETYRSNKSAIIASNVRRQAEWRQHLAVETRAVREIDKQLLAAQIRQDIAERELEIHQQKSADAKTVETFLKQKFTDRQLYRWMSGQLSSVYFQTYKLAYDAAKRAEQAYRFERGVDDSNFIQFGYWDSLKKGLLCGDKLLLDLQRMDNAYLDDNRREFEITRDVSLLELDPVALVTLKQTGVCEFELPETLFDGDFPGHYLRRLKNVALSLPCVVGPYVGVNCTVTLLSSKVRHDPAAQPDYAENLQIDDPRFFYRHGALSSRALSHGRSDAGVFELNLQDARYLPFEGAGAVSSWRVELPQETNRFDIDTLSDVIFHLRYTARDGGALLQAKALDAVAGAYPKEYQRRFISVRHEFPDDWQRFLYELQDGAAAMTLALDSARFPFPYRDKTIELSAMEVLLKLKNAALYQGGDNVFIDVQRRGGPVYGANELVLDASLGVPKAKIFGDQDAVSLGDWQLRVPQTALEILHPGLRAEVSVDDQSLWRLNPETVQDLWILCRYRVTP